MKKTTRQIETVETHNLALCLDRLNERFGNQRAKRALYHALCMSQAISGWEERKAIREALKLP
jgi:hypothetical protein